MNLKYERTRPNVTTIAGLNFFPGKHTLTISEQEYAKVKKDDAWAFEVKKGFIKVGDFKLADAATEGVVSLRELEQVVNTMTGEIEKLEDDLEEAKKKKASTKEIKELISETKKGLKDAENAVEIRKDEIAKREEDK